MLEHRVVRGPKLRAMPAIAPHLPVCLHRQQFFFRSVGRRERRPSGDVSTCGGESLDTFGTGSRAC